MLTTITLLFLYSQLLYDITSSDCTSPGVPVVQRWILLLGTNIGVVINYTKRVHTYLVNRANYLKRQMKVLSGGAPRRKFFQKTWELKLRGDETTSSMERVKSLETELTRVKERRAQHLAQKVQEQEAASTTTMRKGRKRTKSLEDYSVSHQQRLKHRRKSLCADSLAWMERDGYVPLRLEVQNVKSGKVESIVLQPEDAENVFGPDASSATDCDLDMISMLLYVKDRYDVSGSAYHEMTRVCKNLPRSYKLKQRIAELNQLWNIRPTPNGTCGVQQSLEDRVRVRISHLHKVAPSDATFRTTKTVNIKLSGDGTNIGKRLHVVNFTFTLLEEGPLAYSSDGNHTLAIIKDEEKYEPLRDVLQDIRNEVERLSSITVDGQTYDITYYLGGDWKFLAMATGIDSASSEYACIWCKCPIDERCLTDKQWSITDTSLGARTVEENIELSSRTRTRHSKSYNVSRPPLFPTIPLTNVVIDNLHLFLRVSDVLIDLLILELRRQDSIEKTRKFSNFDVKKCAHLGRYQEFVASLGISGYNFYVGKASKQLKCRTLTGPEKLKLLSRINIQELLPSLPESETIQIQVLWTQLLRLNQMFSKRPEEVTDDEITLYEKQSREWVIKFTQVYPAKHVTPYIHAMFNHVGQFMRLHGSILPFTQQGLEKFNDVMT